MSERESLVEALARGLYEAARDGYNGDLGPYESWPHALPLDHDEFRLQASKALDELTAPAAVVIEPSAAEVEYELVRHWPIVTGTYDEYPMDETLRCKCQSDDDEDLDGWVETSDGGGSSATFGASFASHVALALAARTVAPETDAGEGQ